LTPAYALQIPYAGGKQGESIEIRTLTPSPFPWGQSSLGSVTIEIAGVFSIRFREVAAQNDSSFCSSQDAALGKIFLQISGEGVVRQLADSGMDWQLHQTRPPETDLIVFASLPLPGDPGAVGYRFASVGSCEGSHQFVAPNWNRLIFIRNGSRHTKVAIVAKQDTAWGTLPYYGYLKTITLRYVVNDWDELSDPVAIRPVRPSREHPRFNASMEYDLYNPLGVRLRREPGPFEAALPSSRTARPPHPEVR
jgi:hypothetical protein